MKRPKRASTPPPPQGDQGLRVLTGVVVVAIAAGGYWIFQHGAPERRAAANKAALRDLDARFALEDRIDAKERIAEGRQEEADLVAEREENARKRQAEKMRFLREKAERAKGLLTAMGPGDPAKRDPARIELGQAIIDYVLALQEEDAPRNAWDSWLRSVQHQPDPIGEQARTLLDPQEEKARKAFLDGSDGHREQKPRFDEVR